MIVSFLYRFFASNAFFYGALVFLALSALWVSLSAAYPLPFDEYYHFGIIKIYAGQWGPFIAVQPAEASLYGDITRTTSYLYHYLMSFPLRGVMLFTQNEAVHIIVLRCLNILLAVGGLWVFRRVFLRAGLSKPLVHAVLAFVALTPIVALLAAHINYDNLLFLVTALSVLLAQKLLQQKTLHASTLVLFVSIGLLGCLIKYPYTAIFAALVLYCGFVLVRRYKWRIIQAFAASLRATSAMAKVGLFILLFLSVGLFAERYIGNVILFHDPLPACEVVQSPEVCIHYTPWLRDQKYLMALTQQPPLTSVFEFTRIWVDKIIEGFFIPFSHIVDGPRTPSDPFGPIVTKPLMPVVFAMGWLVFVVGVVLLVRFGLRLWRQKELRLFMVVTGVYLFVLWSKNFSDYLALGEPLAIQARYVLLVLPLLLVLIAQAAAYLIRWRQVRVALVAVLLLLYLQGAGAISYIVRSEPSWYWKNPTVVHTNAAARWLLERITIH